MLGIRRYLRFDDLPLRFLGLHHRPRAAPPRSVTVVLVPLREALCLSLRHISYPHRRGGGRRRPHSCTAFAVAARHFGRFPFARRRRFRRCSDSVCDTLTGQGGPRSMFPDHAELAAPAGAARGSPFQVRREAHPSMPILPRRWTLAPFLQLSLSASSAVRPAASSHRQAFLSRNDWLRPGRRSRPC